MLLFFLNSDYISGNMSHCVALLYPNALAVRQPNSQTLANRKTPTRHTGLDSKANRNLCKCNRKAIKVETVKMGTKIIKRRVIAPVQPFSVCLFERFL